MRMLSDLTAEQLREILSYDESTGIFRWKVTNGGRTIGNVAGTICSQGYISIGVNGRYYKAHRLAWLYVHGTWPANLIDHKDGNPSNNGIENLREATGHQNQVNRRRHVPNKTGFRGVSRQDDKFFSQPAYQGRRYFLGTFETAEAAHEAYLAFWKARGGEFLPQSNRVPILTTGTAEAG